MAPTKIKKSSAYNLRSRKTEAPPRPATETDENKRVTRSSTSSSSSEEPEMPIPPESTIQPFIRLATSVVELQTFKTKSKSISTSVLDDVAKKNKRKLDSTTAVEKRVSPPPKRLKKVIGSLASLDGSSKIKKRRKKRRIDNQRIEGIDIEAIEGERKTKYGETEYLIRWSGYK
jgi:hypothetical protein